MVFEWLGYPGILKVVAEARIGAIGAPRPAIVASTFRDVDIAFQFLNLVEAAYEVDD